LRAPSPLESAGSVRTGSRLRLQRRSRSGSAACTPRVPRTHGPPAAGHLARPNLAASSVNRRPGLALTSVHRPELRGPPARIGTIITERNPRARAACRQVGRRRWHLPRVARRDLPARAAIRPVLTTAPIPLLGIGALPASLLCAAARRAAKLWRDSWIAPRPNLPGARLRRRPGRPRNTVANYPPRPAKPTFLRRSPRSRATTPYLARTRQELPRTLARLASARVPHLR